MERKSFSGATVEDAITAATMEMGVPSDEIGYEVIEKGTKGFLGIGSKPAVIEAWIKTAEEKKAEKEAAKAAEAKKEPEKPAKAEEKPAKKEAKPAEEKKEPVAAADLSARAEAGKQFLSDVFEKMNMKVNIDCRMGEDNTLEIDLSGDEMGVLIGKRGQTLDSLQYLTSLVVNRTGEGYIRVKLDTENYRERRRETLESLAKNIAYKVKRTKKSVSLEPMNPYERRIIHSVLQSDNFVMTRSEGEEPYRHVVVFYKRNRNGEER